MDHQDKLEKDQLESVMRRVQKMLAIAQDDRADPAEAAAAASQAEKIMRKYQLDHADILASRIQRNPAQEMDSVDVVATAKDNGTRVEKVPVWASWLAYEIGLLFDCPYRYAWVDTKKGREIACRFSGYRADVQVAAWMFDYLVATVNRLCKEARKSPGYLEGGRTWMNSYRLGMVNGIIGSLKALEREKDAAMQAAVQSRALVVSKAQAIAEVFGEVKYRKATQTEIKAANAYSAGREVGKQVDVNRRGVGHDAVPSSPRLGRS